MHFKTSINNLANASWLTSILVQLEQFLSNYGVISKKINDRTLQADGSNDSTMERIENNGKNEKRKKKMQLYYVMDDFIEKQFGWEWLVECLTFSSVFDCCI